MMSASSLEDHGTATRFTTREQGRSTWQGTESEALSRFGSAPPLDAKEMDLHAMRDAVSRAVETRYQGATACFDEYVLVIDHLGDLLAHQMAETESWRACAVGYLPQITGLRAELAAARAEIERQREYIAGRNYEC